MAGVEGGDKKGGATPGRRDAPALRREEEHAGRWRTFLVVSACAVVGVVIVGLGAFPLTKNALTDDGFGARALQQIGTPEARAACSAVTKTSASGGLDHRDAGSQIEYETLLPAFGPHYAVPAVFSRKSYSQDRPAVPTLAHNLEHGFTILRYDDAVAGSDQQLAEVREIANVFEKDRGPAGSFVAARWTTAKGASFPDGMHIALTHWSTGRSKDSGGQLGVTQYCASPSGEVVANFMEAYPYSDSPEPNAS